MSLQRFLDFFLAIYFSNTRSIAGIYPIHVREHDQAICLNKARYKSSQVIIVTKPYLFRSHSVILIYNRYDIHVQ